jgi:succinate dehydrogenase / fumarate reductase cytochrome b subunit
MSDTRPVNLELTTVRLPITAYASILHRVCAVIVWVGLAALLAIVSMSLNSRESFLNVLDLLGTNFLVQFVCWGFLSALGYYCMGTVKHIIQDFGFFEDKAGGKFISTLALVLGVILAALAGVLVWA